MNLVLLLDDSRESVDESQPAHIRSVFEKLVALHFEP